MTTDAIHLLPRHDATDAWMRHDVMVKQRGISVK